jgi:hypothetical protein
MISNVSQVYKSNPYIPPVDLNLLNSVLAIKENSFKTNAAQIQQDIDTFSGLDVIRDVDKEYLSKKVNNVVSQINGLGGVDLSNAAVSSQLSSMASTIGQDSNIINASTSTKLIRGLTTAYDKMKTDPKMKGIYSDVNYQYDMQNVNSYLQSTDINASYNGTSTPTPYTDIDKKIAAELKSMKANLVKDISNPGMYIETTTNKRLSYDDVFEAAKQRVLTDPASLGQAQRNAWFFGKDRDPQQVVGELYQVGDQKIQRAEEQLKIFQQRKALSVNDPTTQKDAEESITKLNSFIKNQKLYLEDLKTNGIKKYQEAPEQYHMDAYLNNFADGMARLYSFNESSRDVKADTAKLMQGRLMMEGLKSGYAVNFDPISGLPVFTFDPKLKAQAGKGSGDGKGGAGNTGYIDTTISNYGYDISSDPEGTFRVTPEKLAEETSMLATKKQDLITTYLKEISNYRPELKDMFTKDLIDKLVNYGKGKNSNDTSLGVEDLEMINDPSAKGLTEAQRTFVKTAWEGWKTKALGGVGGVKNLPEGMNEVFDQIQEIDNRQNLNTVVIKKGVNELGSKIGLTKEEQKAYEDFLVTRPDAWEISAGRALGEANFDFLASIFTGLSPRVSANLQNVFEKLDKSKKEDKEEFWNNLSKRMIPKSASVVNLENDQGFQDYIISQYTKEKGNEAFPGTPGQIKSGQLIKNYAGKPGGEWMFVFTLPVGKKGEQSTSAPIYVPVSNETAKRFGMQTLSPKYENIEREIDYNEGVSFDRVLSNSRGFSGTFRVARRPGVGGYDVQVKYLDSSGKPATRVLVSSLQTPSDALSTAEKFVYEFQGTREQLLEELNKKLNQ